MRAEDKGNLLTWWWGAGVEERLSCCCEACAEGSGRSVRVSLLWWEEGDGRKRGKGFQESE